MDIEIIERKENPLLSREEVKFRVTHSEGTPSRETVAAKLAAIVNADRNMTILKKIETEFGKNVSLGKAHVYTTEKAREIEPNYILVRNGIGGDEE